MKSLKDRFEECYAAVEKPANNKDGFKIEYVYYAPWYIWDRPEGELKKIKLTFLAATIASLICFIIAGAQRCMQNTTFVVAVPGILSLCAHVFELFAIAQFAAAKYKTTKMTYNDVHRIMTVAPAFRVGMMVISSVGCIYYMFTKEMSYPAMIALLGFASCGMIATYLYREYKKIPLRTERNWTLEELAKEGRLH